MRVRKRLLVIALPRHASLHFWRAPHRADACASQLAFAPTCILGASHHSSVLAAPRCASSSSFPTLLPPAVHAFVLLSFRLCLFVACLRTLAGPGVSRSGPLLVLCFAPHMCVGESIPQARAWAFATTATPCFQGRSGWGPQWCCCAHLSRSLRASLSLSPDVITVQIGLGPILIQL